MVINLIHFSLELFDKLRTTKEAMTEVGNHYIDSCSSDKKTILRMHLDPWSVPLTTSKCKNSLRSRPMTLHSNKAKKNNGVGLTTLYQL